MSDEVNIHTDVEQLEAVINWRTDKPTKDGDYIVLIEGWNYKTLCRQKWVYIKFFEDLEQLNKAKDLIGWERKAILPEPEGNK